MLHFYVMLKFYVIFIFFYLFNKNMFFSSFSFIFETKRLENLTQEMFQRIFPSPLLNKIHHLRCSENIYE